MFTPYSVQCFTPKTGLPTGNTPLGNRIHYVFKVLVACSAYYRWVQDLYSACNLIISTFAGYLLRTKSYCSRLAHPFLSESCACQLQTGWGSLLTCYPPHHQPLRAVWWEYPAVQMAGKWGFIDRQGKSIVTPQFLEVGRFKDGLAKVISTTGLVGFIDRQGKSIIPTQFAEGRDFSEGLAMVKINDKYGFISPNGRVKIAPQFDNAWSFQNGIANVKVGRKYGSIDRQGNWIVAPRWDWIVAPRWDWNDRCQANLMVVKIGKKYGYADCQGNSIVTPRFDYAEPIVDGLALVKQAGKIGYIKLKLPTNP